MSERDKGFYKFLFLPFVYRFFIWIIGADALRAVMTKLYIKPSYGDKVLDIGCGTGEILDHLTDVSYYGYDINADYIESAKKKYGHKGNFFCEEVNTLAVSDAEYDITLAIGLLHHLSDEECKRLFELASTSLKKNGRLITLDGVYTEDQSFLARFFVSRDRGKHIRTVSEYTRLAKMVFSDVEVHTQNKMLRLPYTHIILICKK